MSPPRADLSIVGAGLAGPLLAILCARRGLAVRLYERRSDPRAGAAPGGRSINLALAARGIAALERAGLMAQVRPLMIPMRGRMLHERHRAPVLVPYGQRPHELIYSVSRAALNRVLIEEAARQGRLELNFGHSCLGATREGQLELRDERSGELTRLDAAPLVATDGAGSAVRTSLVDCGAVSAREEVLDHDYRELTIPARAGKHALEMNALHVWPRSDFMLIALPNTDGTFTATLFLPRTGGVSFQSLATSQAVSALFEREFPDVQALLPDLTAQFAAHPQGRLGTVHAAPWHVGAEVLLLGDAAHAIVPFHGQGMNAAFEDCVALDALVAQPLGWAERFARFEAERRPQAQAIARMAIENYAEMREHVRDPRFLRQRALALELEQRFPERFIPRYSMVMFHPEIPYAEALRRGAVQQEILEALAGSAPGPSGIDEPLAARLIRERLPLIGR